MDAAFYCGQPRQCSTLTTVLTNSKARIITIPNMIYCKIFVSSAKSAGIGYGFYYSIMKNFFLCRSFSGRNSCVENVLPGQFNVSDAEYHNIVKQHVTELWTQYGNLTEIWVDSALQGFGDLMIKLQPTAAGTPAHPNYWCGTESGHPSRDVGDGPIWQTGESYLGDPDSDKWVDKFCDPQLFLDHIWFWGAGT